MSVQLWQATGFIRAIEDTRTKPLILECERQDDEGRWHSERFLVKSEGHPSIYAGSLFAELFGSLLAREWGIATPQPALVKLEPDFLSAIHRYVPGGVQLQVGWGVGAQWLPGLRPLPRDWRLPAHLCPAAHLLYGFDLMVANPDRRIGNPNCALWEDTLLAYDFELCFSFLQALLSPLPHQVSLLSIAHKHVLQKPLLSQIRDWNPFAAQVKLLDASNLAALTTGFPPAWCGQQARVFSHLLGAQNELKAMLLEMELSLRATK